ncbi:MAG TPA: hypothetical protein VD866_17640 [Urbifossiella sp.]|nr:hypothetical protein [Urbifossiella sp.]
MAIVLLTVILTTACNGLVLWLALRRVFSHLHGNPKAQAAITEHVLTPLFGEKLQESS